MIAYIFYTQGHFQFFMIWTSVPGFYGSIVLYAMPWVFLALQVGITQKGKVQAAPGSYVIFLFVVDMSLWILNSVMHLVFVPRMDAYIVTLLNQMAKTQTKCPLKRGNLTDAEYVAACQGIANSAKNQLKLDAEKEKKAAADALVAAADALEEGSEGEDAELL